MNALTPAWREELTRQALRAPEMSEAVLVVPVRRLVALLAVVEAADDTVADHPDRCLCMPCVLLRTLRATP
jgi:hypothetical protein